MLAVGLIIQYAVALRGDIAKAMRWNTKKAAPDGPPQSPRLF